jgi:hypothetical protein
VGSRAIRLAKHVVHERFPRRRALEIAPTADEQRLLELALECAVAGFDVAVLLLLPDLRCARPHAVVAHQHEVLLVEWPLSTFDGLGLAGGNAMRRRCRVVRLVMLRHAAELKQRSLHATTQRRKRFAQAHRGPLPIRVRQHEHAQQMHEQLPADRHAELGRPREIRLCRFTGPVCLREHHLAVGAVLRAPALEMPLQRPQLARLVTVGMALDQYLEDRFRLERGARCDHLFDFRPVPSERILSRQPVSLLAHLRRQPRRLHVLPRRLPIHSGDHRGPPDFAMLAHFFHQLPHLRIAAPSQVACLSIPWRASARPASQRSQDGAM